MGVAKSEVLFRGRTFLQHVTRAAAQVFSRVWYVAREPLPDVPLQQMILDRCDGVRAPIFGLRAALLHADAAPLWLLGCDFPLMSADALSYLAKRWSSSGGGLFVPLWDGEPQMLCAGYGAATLAPVEQHIADGNFRLRDLLPVVDHVLLPEKELRERIVEDPFLNVNTPADVAELRSRYE